MKNYTLFIFTFLINTIFSQENPWINNSEKNPWIKDTSHVIPNSSTKDSISLTSKIQIFTFSDSSNLTTENQIDFCKLGKQETSGKGDFFVGFTSGYILNVVGIIPATIGSIIPTPKSKQRVNKIKNEYPTLSKRNLKNYKKGVQLKRSNNAILGVLAGSISQIITIIILIKLI